MENLSKGFPLDETLLVFEVSQENRTRGVVPLEAAHPGVLALLAGKKRNRAKPPHTADSAPTGLSGRRPLKDAWRSTPLVPWPRT